MISPLLHFPTSHLLSSSLLLSSPLFSSLLISSPFLSSLLFPSPLFSSPLLSSLLISSHLISTLLFSSPLFPSPFLSSLLFSSFLFPKPLYSSIFFFVLLSLTIQALSAVDDSNWSSAASYSNSAYIICLELHTYFFSHIHDVVVTAATTSIDSHNNTLIRESVLKNNVEEIDLEDQDSFAYFYTKFMFVCGIFFISCFNGVKSTVKYYKNRKILM